ncbi:type II restriction endonuclease [Evansella clarkii]|uniref:type II restriction endonuclease n=1 Tax=Evansella clarkii TaxID=79879 RepID=UPI000B44E43F|nr:type II restriction endonuclease [Evansella clarkii]
MLIHDSRTLTEVLKAARESGCFYCKFITANDVGLTKAHQEGLHIAKQAWNIFFDRKGIKGENKDKFVKIHIQNYYPFESRVIYYGKGTRDEYRITRFWANSPFYKEEQVGNLIVFIPLDSNNYKVFILDTEEEIENFANSFSLSLVDTNAVYYNGVTKDTDLADKLKFKTEELAKEYDTFPGTLQIAEAARNLYYKVYKNNRSISPDSLLLKWIEIEYSLFRAVEKKIYEPFLTEPFYSLDPLLDFANSALNRRKSRAGRSLEHHLRHIFQQSHLPFDHPGKTEGNKKPDFLFPSNETYRDSDFRSSNLIFLGAKTTCKDRWRQILNEADKIPNKHLITLQQGITINQLDEMQGERVTLVVPEPYHKAYPESHRDRLWTLTQFLEFIKEKYSKGTY